jgi:hypothetical protein
MRRMLYRSVPGCHQRVGFGSTAAEPRCRANGRDRRVRFIRYPSGWGLDEATPFPSSQPCASRCVAFFTREPRQPDAAGNARLAGRGRLGRPQAGKVGGRLAPMVRPDFNELGSAQIALRPVLSRR